MIVQKLKQYVTSFSAAIPYQHKHGDIIWVGGDVVDIFTIPCVHDLIPESERKEEPVLDAVYLTLDDGVGLNRLMIPRLIYLKYKEAFDLKLGMVVLAEGKVYIMEMKEKGKPILNHPEAAPRIICWRILPLPDAVPAESL
jgi:hypothetical protein